MVHASTCVGMTILENNEAPTICSLAEPFIGTVTIFGLIYNHTSFHRKFDVDAVACDGDVVAMTISEHMENARVHSGNATLVLPAQDLNHETMSRITRAVAAAHNVTGQCMYSPQPLMIDGERKRQDFLRLRRSVW